MLALNLRLGVGPRPAPVEGGEPDENDELLLSGDAQTEGTDALALSGDAGPGNLLLSGDAAT